MSAVWFLLVLGVAVALWAGIRRRWRPWRIERRLADPLADIERVTADAVLEMKHGLVDAGSYGGTPRFFASPFDARCRAQLNLPRGEVEALGLDVMLAHRALLRGMDSWDKMAGTAHVPDELLPAMEEVYRSCRALGGSLSPSLLGRARRGVRVRPLVGVVAEVPPVDAPVN